MNRSECQGTNVRRSHAALSVFAVLLFGLLNVGSTAASVVSRYAYVPGNNGVSIYTVNLKTGQLRNNGYAFPGSPLANATVDPSGKFLYALGSASLGVNSISAFTINATTGALAEVAGSPYATGSGPAALIVDPLVRFVYVSNSTSNNVSAYTIDSDTGALTPVAGSPFASGLNPVSMAINPTGSFFYVCNENDSPGGDVSGYTINASTGALTPMDGSPFLSRSGASAIAITPSGKFGYIGFGYLDGSHAQITAFSINPTTGIPTAIKGSPFLVSGTGSNVVVVSPSGDYLYSMEWGLAGTVAALKVNATGKLTPVTGSPFAVGTGANTAMSIDPGGSRLYARTNGSSEVWTYKIASGALSLLNEVRTQSGNGPLSVTTGSAAVAYTPKFAYVANQGSDTVPSSVSAYAITSTNGHLSAVSGSPFADGGSEVFAFANSVTVDPSGRFAYVANGNTNDVAAYTIDGSTGALTEISGSPFAAETNPFSVAVDPSGRFVYVANNGSYNISGFAINSSTGALTPISGSPFSTGTTSAGPVSVTVDPTGQFVYVANSDILHGSISALAIDPSTGGLTSVSGSPFADTQDPGSVAVDASGRAVFVANLEQVPDSGGQYKMLAFTINPNSGALTNPLPSPNLGASTPSVVTDPLGQFLYSPQNADGGILSLSFDTQTTQFSNPIDSPNICVDETPTSMTVDMSGKFVYVANSSTNNVTACKINQTTGDLNNIAGETAIPAGTSPVSVITTGTVQ